MLALIASTVATFAASSLLTNGKLRPVDIQNATLAGGVAIGAVADFKINPIGALALGTAAGLVSTLGYQFVQPFLERTIRLHDSCGIHNLHGMPALLGALASVILPYCIDLTGIAEPDIQAAATILTVLVAISSGAITGAVMRAAKRLEPAYGVAFTDVAYWDVADDFPKV